MRKLCFVALSTLLVIAACKKNEKAVTEVKPETRQGRILEKVFIKSGDSAVYIPLNPGDSIRQTPTQNLKKVANISALAMCVPTFTITPVNWSFTINAGMCFSVTPASNVDWYLFADGAQVGYLGTFPPNQTSLTVTGVPIICGKTYYVQVRYQYVSASGAILNGIDNGVNHWTAGILQTVGLGVVGDGADLKITDVNNNGVADLVFLAYDDAPGANYFKYYFLLDVNSGGSSSTAPVVQSVIGMGNEGNGAGVAIEDINGNGIKDLIVMAYDDPPGANSFRYRVGFDLSSTGVPTSWSPNYIIGGVGDVANGSGIALWDIDQNGVKDIILMAYVDAPGANSFRYKIGKNPNSMGEVAPANWSAYVDITGVGDKGHGAGFDIRDVDGNGSPEFFFMAYDDAGAGENEFRYRVVHNVNTLGIGTVNPNYFTIRGVGGDGHGGGLAIGDITGDGRADMLLMAYDDTPGNVANTFRTLIGYDLPSNPNLIQPTSFWCGF